MTDIVERLNNATKLPALASIMNEAASEILVLRRDLKDCRNELCLFCGLFKTAHLGSCNGCRWRDTQ